MNGNQQGAAAPIIPIQLCKLPPPRDLTLDESRESICNWCDSAQNFLSRDDKFTRFVQPAEVWNPAAPNYGFVNEGPNTRLRRTAPEVAAALQLMFKALSGFFPFNFLSRKFPTSTSWASIKEMILTAYNHQVDGISLLKAAELKRSPEEKSRQSSTSLGPSTPHSRGRELLAVASYISPYQSE